MPIHKEAVDTLKINFFGTLSACDILFPLLRSNARCVNVTSRMGFLERITNEKLVEKLSDTNLSREELIQMVDDYIRFGLHLTNLFLFIHSALEVNNNYVLLKCLRKWIIHIAWLSN